MNWQFVVFLNCCCIGVFTGLTSDICYILKKIFRDNKIVSLVLEFCIYFVGSSFIFVLASNLNYDIFEVYEVIGFVLGVMLEKISCKNLFAKFFDMLYNGFTKLAGKIKMTKLGRKAFK